jgi:aspartate-semialdehyde dehydrogenase
LVIALKPIEEAFGISRLFVVTMQAVSGAGYPGVRFVIWCRCNNSISSYDITGNVIPYISGGTVVVDIYLTE